MTTFAQVVDAWRESAGSRQRNPLLPSTLKTDNSYLRRHILPHIKDLELTEVDNEVLRNILVPKWGEAGLSEQTQTNVFKTLAKVIRFAADTKGRPLHKPDWNLAFADLPVVNKAEQKRPCYTAEQVTAIVARAHREYRVLYALLAGTGMRVNEALALKVEDVGPSEIRVHGNLFEGKVYQTTRTKKHDRIVDMVPQLADMVWTYIGDREVGWLFPTKFDTPMRRDNIAVDNLDKVLETLEIPTYYAFHAFRRFRAGWLKVNGVPSPLANAWMGWSSRTMYDHYSESASEWQGLRDEWSGKIGLGFELPEVL